MSGGRPKGSKNTPGHVAGGKRDGAGRKEKVNLFVFGPLTNSDNSELFQEIFPALLPVSGEYKGSINPDLHSLCTDQYTHF